MKKSPLRHPLAVLRLKIGLSQDEMAEAVNCPLGTLKSLELGRRPLSEEMAVQIATATAVNLGWLLRGDTHAPIIDWAGDPYHAGNFEMAQAAMTYPKMEMDKDIEEIFLRQRATDLIERFRQSFMRATYSGRYQLFVWRVTKVFEQTDREYESLGNKAAHDRYMTRYRRMMNERQKKGRSVVLAKKK